MNKEQKIEDLYNLIEELEERIYLLEENANRNAASLDELEEWQSDTTDVVMYLLDKDEEVDTELATNDARLEDLEYLHEDMLEDNQ